MICPICGKEMKLSGGGQTVTESRTTFICENCHHIEEIVEPIANNILEPLQPNTLSLNCESIHLNQKGIKVEIDINNSNLDHFDYINLNGRLFQRVNK